MGHLIGRLHMWLLYVIGGLGLAFFLFVFIAALSERLRLKGDLAPVSEPFPRKPAPYWLATREEARRMGMRHGRDFANTKSLIKGLQSLWITQDRHVLVAIEAGSSAGSVKRTSLRTRLEDGRILESSDNPGLSDMGGTIDKAVLINAGLKELLGFHLQRIVQSGSPALLFKSESLLEEYEQIDMERGRRMVELGLARWADPEQTSVRMTFRGAVKHLQHDYFKQMKELRGQSERSNIRRAGS